MNVSTIESVPDSKVQTPSSPFWRGTFLALASAALMILSFPNLPLPWLAWVAFVPLGLGLRRSKPWTAAFFAGLAGWGFWFGAIWWVQAPLRDILSFSPVAAFALTFFGCGILALPYAIAGWLVCIQRDRGLGLWGSAKNAAIFAVAIIWLPALFEANIVHTQFENLRILQVLDLGGTPLLLFLILWVNWLVVEIISNAKIGVKAIAKPAITLAAAIASLLGYGHWRLADFGAQMKTSPAKSWFTVGSIQPNIPVIVPPERQPAPLADRTNDFFSALQQAAALVEKRPDIDLLALPECPDFFVFNADEKRRTALADMIVQTHKPVVLNATLFDARRPVAGNPGRYNVNVFVDSAAFVTNSYRKMKLVPFVENIPGENDFPWLRKIFPKSLGIIPGPKPVLFDVKPGVRVIPLICYEGTSSSFTRRFVELGGNIVVNLINDSWFLRTPGAKCHMALAAFRAVEFRLPFVRVTNSGMGAFVQPTGEIIPGSRTALFEKTATAFPVYIPAERSFYAKYGDWFLILLTGVLVMTFGRDGWKFLSTRATPLGPQTRHRKKRRTYYYH